MIINSFQQYYYSHFAHNKSLHTWIQVISVTTELAHIILSQFATSQALYTGGTRTCVRVEQRYGMHIPIQYMM